MCKFQQYYQVCFTMLADIIPTHQAAQWLLTHIDRLLDHLGLDRAKGVEEWVYVAVIVAVALLQRVRPYLRYGIRDAMI